MVKAGKATIGGRFFRGRGVALLFGLLVLSVSVLFIADIAAGSTLYSLRDLIRIAGGGGSSTENTILFSFRLPRAITAMLAGAALSVSGLQMQSVFRNPLAGPYVLGISSGASLGVALLILGSASLLPGVMHRLTSGWAMVIAAWAGAVTVLLVIMVVSARVRDIMTVLILGIMIGGAISAVVSILQYFSNESLLKSFVIWTMGSLGNLTWSQLNILLLSVATGLLLAVAGIKRMNALLLGEEYAKTMGMNIYATRFLIFVSTSILAGSVTAFCGPIAFIGIAVPHIARMLIGRSSAGYLLPASALTGMILLLVADIVSQLPGSDRVLPVNSVTALIGIPVMIWIIMRRNRFLTVN